ncbi:MULTISPECIES: hypothetical protein [Xanthomonas]|uniref:hypothetical protein n=1 Tax=Xanthomonas TaxID=338 RepID=UPI001ADC1EF7|nr:MULTISPECIES: hypothetical protein [unclassified Xanthomonas]MBO9872957.1 hypothetical protein [Xanthomonas sp. D-93]WNH44826.1 hypothetical protein PG878_20375 [Xanthomonas sp. A6251]
MRKPLLLLFAIPVLLISSLAGCLAYNWVMYINRAVSAGEAYGLTIGETKKEVFHKLPTAFKEIGASEGGVFVEVLVSEARSQGDSGRGARHRMVGLNFGAINSPSSVSFYEDDQWVFYIGPSHNNFLRLKFCDKKLCRIYRYRRYFELS